MRATIRNCLALGAALALPALTLPAVSYADTALQARQTATRQCSRALAEQLGVPVARAQYQQPRYNPLQIYVRPRRQLRLQVYNARSGALVATGLCQYNRNGQVVKIMREPGYSMNFGLTGPSHQ